MRNYRWKEKFLLELLEDAKTLERREKMRKRKRTKKVWKKVFVVALSGAISVATVPVNTLAAQTSVEQVENESQLVNTGTKETEENTDEIPGETTKQSEQETQETERKGGENR